MEGIAPNTKEIRVRNYLIKRIVTRCFPEPIQREKEPRIQAWYDNYLQSLIKTPKVHITDTGIICAARGINSDKLINNPDIFGSLLEMNSVFLTMRAQDPCVFQDFLCSHC